MTLDTDNRMYDRAKRYENSKSFRDPFIRFNTITENDKQLSRAIRFATPKGHKKSGSDVTKQGSSAQEISRLRKVISKAEEPRRVKGELITTSRLSDHETQKIIRRAQRFGTVSSQ